MEEDLKKYHGKRFTTTYWDDRGLSGRICIEDNRIYLCQDEHNGNKCDEKFGYKYSWELLSTDMDRSIKEHQLKIIDADETTKTPDNLLDYHGRAFSARIDGTYCEGKISVEGEEVYLCQDVNDGDNADDKLGYEYSYRVEDGSEDNLRYFDVTEFKLISELTEASSSKSKTEAFKNLFDKHGYSFSCKIEGEYCEGVISVNRSPNKVYLCQNEKNGDLTSDRFGYSYSWIVDDGSPEYLTRNDVTDFVITSSKAIRDEDVKPETKSEGKSASERIPINGNRWLDEFKTGMRFTAEIRGRYCEGKVCIEFNDVYLCQDFEKGSECRDKQGYKYSYALPSYKLVSDLRIETDSDFVSVATCGDKFIDHLSISELTKIATEAAIGKIYDTKGDCTSSPELFEVKEIKNSSKRKETRRRSKDKSNIELFEFSVTHL